MAYAKRDENRIPTLLGVSSVDGITPVVIYADPITHRLFVDLPSGSGDMTKSVYDPAGGEKQVAFLGDTVQIYSYGTLNFYSDAGTTLMGNIASNSAGNYGFLNSAGTLRGNLDFSLIATSDKTFTFPNADGTIALTSDIPDVSGFITNIAGQDLSTADNSTSAFITLADIPSQVEDSIVDGHTTIAPSGNAVFDALALKAPLASPTFTGTVTLADNARINLTLPTADTYVTGNVTASFNSGYSSAASDLVFFGSGGKWLEVDADAVATCNGLLGIALEAKTDGQAMKVALPGSFVRYDAWNWTVGATLYAGEILGAMQETIPTGADAIIKVVGFAVSADVIFFNPSQDQQSTVA